MISLDMVTDVIKGCTRVEEDDGEESRVKCQRKTIREFVAKLCNCLNSTAFNTITTIIEKELFFFLMK